TGRTGRADWVAHGAPEVAPPPVAPALKRRKHPLLFVGAGLVAAGAVASGVTWARADGERYASLDGWKAGRTAYRAGYGAMGVGLALVAVDLAL
ncbi:MAG: hypothetical protein KC656_28015, partial [Myxococcales bacterium]|nr:hypothetical protein [Myxococcales bacterium]